MIVIFVLKLNRNYRACSPHPDSSGDTEMMTTHVCLKTYYVRDRTGELGPITTKTYIVCKLKQDLLSGKMLNKEGYKIIFDEDPEESGVYAVNDRKIYISKSFLFMSKHSNLYCLKIEPLTLLQFEKNMASIPSKNWPLHTHDTIKHSEGLEDLQSKTFEEYVKCPSCMIGKSTLENLPKLKSRATEQPVQVNMDLFSSSVQSIEGYNYAVVLLTVISDTDGYMVRN